MRRDTILSGERSLTRPLPRPVLACLIIVLSAAVLFSPRPACGGGEGTPETLRPSTTTGGHGVGVERLALPWAFVPNHGQFDPRVRFAARGPALGVVVLRGETLLSAAAERVASEFVTDPERQGALSPEPQGIVDRAGWTGRARR